VRYDDPARPSSNGVPQQLCGAPLPVVTLVVPEGANGAWLACIHASRGGNRFGYHSAVLRDLAEFAREYFEDPEACLAKHFGYTGPEEPASPQRARVVKLPDLWED
jgi:hypothetical protein